MIFEYVKSLFKNTKVERPCKACIVGPCCHEKCDKYRDYIIEVVKNASKVFYDEHKMPCCGSTGFYEGPCGGASQNITCADCGEKWNVCTPLRMIEKI